MCGHGYVGWKTNLWSGENYLRAEVLARAKPRESRRLPGNGRGAATKTTRENVAWRPIPPFPAWRALQELTGGWNRISWRTRTSTGRPSLVGGSNCHCFTAPTARSSRVPAWRRTRRQACAPAPSRRCSIPGSQTTDSPCRQFIRVGWADHNGCVQAPVGLMNPVRPICGGPWKIPEKEHVRKLADWQRHERDPVALEIEVYLLRDGGTGRPFQPRRLEGPLAKGILGRLCERRVGVIDSRNPSAFRFRRP